MVSPGKAKDPTTESTSTPQEADALASGDAETSTPEKAASAREEDEILSWEDAISPALEMDRLLRVIEDGALAHRK
ncbi:hypothetical protein [Nonomuraea antimicrobica]|uniref:hypothetical protein n=1 Tax=Nonomuraea antimicrobica TaxID=561173 RepID=UPI0031EF061E